jgi:hypothetical protein
LIFDLAIAFDLDDDPGAALLLDKEVRVVAA